MHAMARGAGYGLMLTPGEVTLELRGTTSLHMRVVGAQRGALAQATDQLTGTANYFLGNDPKRWRTGVPTFGKLRCENIYPGIDLVFYGNQQQLEYDFRVAPEADPNQIKLDFRGADRIHLGKEGDLILQTRAGKLRMRKPLVYQEHDGQRREIAAQFVLSAKRQVSFRVADYDRAQPLIIDPTLVYSVVTPGNGSNVINGTAVDTIGNAYFVGTTNSTNFPTMVPYQSMRSTGFDVFVQKFDPTGVLVYSTYLGGNGDDIGRGIAVDSSGNAYITGWTFSSTFPTKNPFQAARSTAPDAFVAVLNSAGSDLIYSTYLGGSGDDRAYAIAVDSSQNAYITGQTFSINFPTSSPYQAARNGTADVFVTKFNPTGSALTYSTYLGGSQSFEIGNGIAADSDGNAYVVGQTASTDFPRVNPLQMNKGDTSTFQFDAFLTKFGPSGAPIFSTYLGGSGNDIAFAVALDSSRNIYITGATDSFDFPTLNPLYTLNGNGVDAFVTKVNAAGSQLLFSTYLGGNADDFGRGIAVDPTTGNIFITGITASPDFPLLRALQTQGGSGVFQSRNGGTNWNYFNAGLSSPFGTTPTNINALAINPLDSSIYAATAGGVYKSTGGPSGWIVVDQNFTAYSITVDPFLSLNVYEGNFGRVSRSTDGGVTWTDSTTGLPSTTVNSIVVDPTNSSNVFVGTGSASSGGGVYKSTDSGVTWTSVSTGLPTSATNSLLIDPANPQILYAGAGSSSSGGVWRTTNGGTNWSSMSTGLPNKGVLALSFDPTTSTTLLAASIGGIYKTTNSGGNWSPLLTTNFSPLSIAVDPTNPNIIYFGSETLSGQGVFKSNDGGATWTAIGLTDARVTSLAIDRFSGAINAGCGLLASTDPNTDMFLTALNGSGSMILFSSYLGSSAHDEAHGVALDSNCNALVGGVSYSTVGPFGPLPVPNARLIAEPDVVYTGTASSKDPANSTAGKVGGVCGTDCPPITVGTDPLSFHTEDNVYRGVPIRGGTPPYTVTSTSPLPAGLHLLIDDFGTLVIRGVPTQQKPPTNITINVRDSKNCLGSGSVSVTVDPKPAKALQVGKEPVPDNPYDPIARTVTFVVTVINTTGATLDHVDLTDLASFSKSSSPHPAIVSVISDSPAWSCTNFGTTLHCQDNGMPNGAIVHFTVVCDVSKVIPGDFFTNNAGGSGNSGTTRFEDYSTASFTIPPPGMTLTKDAGGIHVTVTGAAPNTQYHMQASADLSPGSFQNVGTVMSSVNGVVQFTDPNPGNRKFYRLVYP